ncbi:MAG: rhodanese-like domain-containing protein [Saprospiraceae bacterium]
MLSFFKSLFKRSSLDYQELMERGAVIIDVRTAPEFSQGHADRSINIPLSEIKNQIKSLKQQNKPLIICCRSGARAGSAISSLKQAGIEAYNAGSWNRVQAEIGRKS